MEDNELVDVKLEDYENEREEFQCYEVEEEIVIGSDGEIEIDTDVIDSENFMVTEEDLMSRYAPELPKVNHRGSVDSDIYFDEEHDATILIVQEESNHSLSNLDVTKGSNRIENEHQEYSNNSGGEFNSEKLHSYQIENNKDINLVNVKSLENQQNLSISYQCIQCSEIFPSYSSFSDHVQQVKSFKFHYTCKQCLKPFEKFFVLMSHIKVEHSKEKILCDKCPGLDEFKTNVELYKHKREVHALNCKYCTRVFYSHDKLEKHMNSTHNNRLDCGVCGKVMNSNQARKTHELTHNDRSEMCWVCGTVVKNKQILSQHMQKHNEKTHQCSICNRVFPSPLYLRRHEKSHYLEEDKCHICHICPKAFTRKNHLEKHILAHSKNTFFMCYACGNAFKSNEKLMLHQRSREALGGNCPPIRKQNRGRKDIKPNNEIPNTLNKTSKQSKEESSSLECDICGRKFIKSFNVIRHRKYHFCKGNPEIVEQLLGEPEQYNCDKCSKEFFTKHALQYHNAMKHTGVAKPFACEFCHKRFRTRPQIMVHERMHSGERPYPCAVCSKTFQTKTHLRHHEHVHSKEKPHLCPLCGLAFRSSSGLMEHTFRHEDSESVRPFQCSFCGNRFITESVLKAHITRNHSVESQQAIESTKNKEGFDCAECGKILVSLIALKKHERRMHRNMLVEVPDLEGRMDLNNGSIKTLTIEDFEDRSEDNENETDEVVQYLDIDHMEMIGSDVEIEEVPYSFLP